MSEFDYAKIVILNVYQIIKIDINIKQLRITIDNKVIKISNNKMSELFQIIKHWNENYYGAVLDAEKFSIKLISNNGTVKTYSGSGKYPHNYIQLKRWISDVI